MRILPWQTSFHGDGLDFDMSRIRAAAASAPLATVELLWLVFTPAELERGPRLPDRRDVIALLGSRDGREKLSHELQGMFFENVPREIAVGFGGAVADRNREAAILANLVHYGYRQSRGRIDGHGDGRAVSFEDFKAPRAAKTVRRVLAGLTRRDWGKAHLAVVAAASPNQKIASAAALALRQVGVYPDFMKLAVPTLIDGGELQQRRLVKWLSQTADRAGGSRILMRRFLSSRFLEVRMAALAFLLAAPTDDDLVPELVELVADPKTAVGRKARHAFGKAELEEALGRASPQGAPQIRSGAGAVGRNPCGLPGSR